MHSYTFGGSSMHTNNSNNGSMPQGPGNGASWSGSWNSNNNASYPPGQHPLPNSPYSRHSMSSSANGNTSNDGANNAMAFSNPRTTASPAAGPDALSAPPFDQSQQHYVTHNPHPMATGAPQHPGLMATSSQPPAQSPLAAHSDGYAHAYAAHTRPGSNPSYYASSGPSQFSSYPPPQHSPTHSSPTTGSPGARGIGALPNSMGYRYGTYGQPPMPGTVMSNMHHPGGQMSMIPGMSQHQGYSSQMVYPHHPAPQPQSERPFKCDQCIQSFSRNHDLKRHKRIHLAVKPFPCNFCSKSFSRKDALKRHRLVKGCETRTGDQNDDASRRQNERERD
ncbi:hypothetical protein V2A60_010138 [Cordyceps javanica]